MVPDMSETVQRVWNENPEAAAHAHHEGDPRSEEFINILATELHTENPLFGLNGKRGNPEDISDDAINYKGEGADFDPTNGNSPVTVIDVIGRAGAPDAFPQWSIVTNPSAPVGAAWVQPKTETQEPEIDSVPWVSYDENSYDRLKKQLAYDYGRRPQGADFDVTVWAARVFHSQYMGPDKHPLGFDAAMQKHRPEWCAALGVPVDNHWE